jgi:bifunctional NMN adenylyltransferase/nudix hydrolase
MSEVVEVVEKQYELLTFIGKFRMFHNGHKHVVDTALKLAHNVLICIGSANRPRSHKLPFTAAEVERSIRLVYPQDSEDGGRIRIVHLDDWMHDGDFTWTINVQRAVEAELGQLRALTGNRVKLRCGLIGYKKDHTSYYLKKFPQWGAVDAGPYRADGRIINATDLRALMFEKGAQALVPFVPRQIVGFCADWQETHARTLADIMAATDFAREYKDEHRFVGRVDPATNKWSGKPYNPTHNTTDAVLIQSGHVLMVRRKFFPGKGLWALPGGFLKDTEPTKEAVTRELKEETKIKLSKNVLDLAFRFKQVFSDPDRSEDRGRIITHAYLYLLNDRADLPEVEGADDAEHAEWVPIGLLDPRTTYSDHYWIIMKMIALIPVD